MPRRKRLDTTLSKCELCNRPRKKLETWDERLHGLKFTLRTDAQLTWKVCKPCVERKLSHAEM